MATTTLQHPTHHHPLVPLDFNGGHSTLRCELCHRKISAEAYTCHEGCESYYHRVCAEAPTRVECHPLHPVHPLPLIHHRPSFKCDVCHELFRSGGSSFRCNECNVELDISCALSTLSDQGGSPGGKHPEFVILRCHPHPLNSFSTRHDFVGDSDCKICQTSAEGDGYMCLQRSCDFIIHKGCIQDLYYADGTRAPQVFHKHRLMTFLGEDTGSSRCAKCESDDTSGEFLGCAQCEVFIHRDCIPVPEMIRRYPPGHTMVLFINCPDEHKLQCGSCSSLWTGELGYRCTSCKFFVELRCALKVLAYSEECMNVEISFSWHERPLFLCHRTKYHSNYCSYCGDQLTGPVYACQEKDCELLFHKECIKVESTIIHPHHPDHPLTLGGRTDMLYCNACFERIRRLNFSCKFCDFCLHVKCATRVPTRTHYLHVHELLCLDKAPSMCCNRCGAHTDSPFLRCVLCNFNLHEKCMELPRVVNSEVHWHPLTLHESYVEDDSGEYYCDHCEKMRDARLGVYVCGQCTARWAYHIECALPELRNVFKKKSYTSPHARLHKQIASKRAEIHATKEKLKDLERELRELMTQCRLYSQDQTPYVSEEGEPENSV